MKAMNRKAIRIDHQLVNAVLPEPPQAFADEITALLAALPDEKNMSASPKRYAAAVILAMLLLMLAAGALAAALLGGREFAQRYLSPKAAQTQSSAFTAAELAEICALAQEKNYVLPDGLLERMQNAQDGFDKEELLRAVVKTELGFYPAAWSIEEQYWYEQLLLACGLLDDVQASLPQENEISQQQAEDRAISCIRERFDGQFEPSDGAAYQRYITFGEYKASQYKQGRMWNVVYEAQDLYHDSYRLQIWADGTIELAEIYARSLSTKDAMLNEITDRFRDVYGSHADWDEQTWMAYSQALHESMDHKTQAPSKSLRMILLQTYAPVPADAAISREAALAAAMASAALSSNALSRATALYLPGQDATYWKVTLHCADGETVMVEINAQTGEAGELLQAAAGDSWARPYVLEENIPATVSVRTSTSAGAFAREDGMPAIWESAKFSDDYWQTLNEYGYHSDTGSKLYDQWCQAYGFDVAFWPDGPYAIDYIWHETYGAQAMVLPGIATDAYISREQAIAIAREQAPSGNSVQAAAHIWLFAGMTETPVWKVEWRETAGVDTSVLLRTSYVDALSGEMMDEQAYLQRMTPAAGMDDDWHETVWQAGDISMEQAVQAARGAAHSLSAGIWTQSELEAFLVQAQLYEGSYEDAERFWVIAFYRAAFGCENSDITIILDAADGAIINYAIAPAETSNG